MDQIVFCHSSNANTRVHNIFEYSQVHNIFECSYALIFLVIEIIKNYQKTNEAPMVDYKISNVQIHPQTYSTR
jgi:hypothetical protein